MLLQEARKVLLPVVCLVVAACSEQAPPPDPKLVRGEAVFNATCKVCHAQGINGAPILGNRKMWSKRAPQGLETLVQHASEGYGLMPAKGGNDTLGTEDIEAAVSYMLSKLEETPK